LGISRLGHPEAELKKTARAQPPPHVQGSSQRYHKKKSSSQSGGGTTGTPSTNNDGDSPAARRRARHWNRLQQRELLNTRHDEIEVSCDHIVHVVSAPTDAPPTDLKQLQEQQKLALQEHELAEKQKLVAPLQFLQVAHEQALELERSISELTMRSSYGEHAVASRIPDNRRMAYYAVGKHHRQSGRGGNRRCYFTGKLILGGAPFYAGSVQQGLRTLVVFCLPSGLGLPKGSDQWSSPNRVPTRERTSMSNRSLSMASHQSSHNTSNLQEQRSSLLAMRSKSHRRGGSGDLAGGSSSVASKSMGMSRLSSLDDLSLSIDGDLDPNWGLDRDYLLKVLPEPDYMLLKTMAKLYPEQFETLPVQVREPDKWKLYVKFCFFSGLPIAQGEMHYKVRDDIAECVYGEEIVLSHEVMEAVNGESAEILSLPNMKAFRYLRKHYAQQCGKLEGGDRVFLRTSWERVLAEV
jgi:hypothetical protein